MSTSVCGVVVMNTLRVNLGPSLGMYAPVWISCSSAKTMKETQNEIYSSRQEGPPHSKPTCWFDWPMAVPAVTRQNTSPATELTLNLSLTAFFSFLPSLLNTHALTSSFYFTQSHKAHFLIYSLFLLFMPMHAVYTHTYVLTHTQACTHEFSHSPNTHSVTVKKWVISLTYL